MIALAPVTPLVVHVAPEAPLLLTAGAPVLLLLPAVCESTLAIHAIPQPVKVAPPSRQTKTNGKKSRRGRLEGEPFRFNFDYGRNAVERDLREILSESAKQYIRQYLDTGGNKVKWNTQTKQLEPVSKSK